MDKFYFLSPIFFLLFFKPNHRVPFPPPQVFASRDKALGPKKITGKRVPAISDPNN